MRVALLQRVLGWLIGGSAANNFVRALFGAAIVCALPSLAVAATTGLTGMSAVQLKPGSQMLVESDQLVYDYDNNSVSAVGNVKIYYNGYTLEAEKVTYLKGSRRLIAAGSVKLTDPSGMATYAEQIDITDDFSDGFVNSLRVETPQKTRFAAERAERSAGETTTFTNGVYTACEPCKDHPEKPPLWQVSAAKIVINHKEKMIYFRDAAFEFMGVPIAWVPYFSTPDPSVKRKTGLLTPIIGYSDPLGWSITVPYFFALAPNLDLTLSPTYYSRQGFMVDAEWRHRLSNGQYTVRVAGISQDDPTAFLVGAAGTFAQRDFRGGIRTTGEFDINQNWSFGWDGTLSTDRTFTRNYHVLNADTAQTVSNIHLTGIGDRAYFDARAMYFQVLTDSKAVVYDQKRQAIVAPVMDYNKVFADPVLGGELTLTSNLTALSRDENDTFKIAGDPNIYDRGIAGSFVRASTEVQWQRQFIGPFGQLITPFASLRGDAFSLNADAGAPAALTTASEAYRAMPAVGVEWSWPVMAQIGASTHIFEPIAQAIVRPDETLAGNLPNEDAQSLVFDDSNLFARDKFSGYDRIEGGSRLNLGVRYTGSFSNGMTVDGLFGQSYQIAGKNPFAQTDIADAGRFSGLETKVSDYVGRVSLDTGLGQRFTARGRFDEKDFTANRVEAQATTAIGPVTASASYIYLRNDPSSGAVKATSAVSGAASVNFVENWRVFGTLTYDATADAIASDSIGLAFDNSCLTLSLAYSETRTSDIPNNQQLTLRVLFRTLGDGNVITANIGKTK